MPSLAVLHEPCAHRRFALGRQVEPEALVDPPRPRPRVALEVVELHAVDAFAREASAQTSSMRRRPRTQSSSCARPCACGSKSATAGFITADVKLATDGIIFAGSRIVVTTQASGKTSRKRSRWNMCVASFTSQRRRARAPPISCRFCGSGDRSAPCRSRPTSANSSESGSCIRGGPAEALAQQVPALVDIRRRPCRGWRAARGSRRRSRGSAHRIRRRPGIAGHCSPAAVAASARPSATSRDPGALDPGRAGAGASSKPCAACRRSGADARSGRIADSGNAPKARLGDEPALQARRRPAP